MNENELAFIIIGKAIDIHKTLGPGLLESAYESCLFYSLQKSGIPVQKQVPLPLEYEEVILDYGYRIDLLVDQKVVIEIKAVDRLNSVHFAQTLTYLKVGGYKLGLLINFNAVTIKRGLKRIINGYI